MSTLIPAKAHYACVAMVELARHERADKPLTLREITERHEIPSPFLVQILQQLKAAGLVSSVRGSQGGYRLTRDPRDVTIADVLTAVCCEPSDWPIDGGADQCIESQVRRIWKEAAQAHREVLGGKRLSDLLV